MMVTTATTGQAIGTASTVITTATATGGVIAGETGAPTDTLPSPGENTSEIPVTSTTELPTGPAPDLHNTTKNQFVDKQSHHPQIHYLVERRDTFRIANK